jgi:Bacterial SH3 domain
MLVLACTTAPAARAADPEVFGRVVVPIAALRTGPGTSFRVLRVAQEGEAFPIVGRANRGYWLEVELPDGSHGYVSGDSVYTYSLGPEEAEGRSRIFAPAPLARARGELAVNFGALDVNGLMAVRPSLLLGPTFGLEANLAAAIGSTGRLLIAGLGGIVNVLPSAKVVPFFAGGGGVVWASPNADTFVLSSGTRSTIYAGGGLRFGFRHHLILRIEGRGYAFFDTDHLDAAAEGSGGLSAFF